MVRFIVLASLLAPTVAFAQPAGDGSGPYAPPAPGAPAGPGPYAAPPPANGAPAGAYIGPQAPGANPFRRGTTVELNLGIGFIHASNDTASSNSDASLAGLSLGVGGWLNDHLALTVRIAGITDSESGGKVVDAFFGPSLQYWFDNNFWAGGGAGLGVLGLIPDQGDTQNVTGFSFDLRAGYTLQSSTANTFNISVEVNPGFYSQNGTSSTFTGVGLLAGYQYL
jgi:hypothetical protein